MSVCVNWMVCAEVMLTGRIICHVRDIMYTCQMWMAFIAQDDMHWLLTILIRLLDKIICKQSVISVVFLEAEQAKIFDICQL